MRIDFAYYTNKGHIRRSNQDALFLDGFGVFGDMRLSATGHIAKSEKAFFAVVDGAGGHACGEIASRTIVGEFIKYAGLFSPDAGALSSSFAEIQNYMTDISKKDGNLSEMAAAMSGVLLCPGEIAAFNVGDCRTYIINRGFLKKLTHDHSIVQTLRDNGMIDDDAMRTHPEKNRITSALMANAGDAPEIYLDTIKTSGEKILFICSDGVWESLPIEAIEAALRPADIGAAARGLLDALTASECRDNISFIIIKICMEESL